MSGRNLMCATLCAYAALLAGPAQSAFIDPLDMPAARSQRIAQAEILVTRRAGERIVAGGLRGLILYSDDHGRTWKQADVPVSTDITSLSFPTPTIGWAAGHKGVVLKTTDAGLHWVRQLDGRQTEALLRQHFDRASGAGDPRAQELLQLVQSNFAAPAEQPWLDVWFKNQNDGFVSGPFGLLMATRDGGTTWDSWIEHVDDTRYQHLNRIVECKGDVFIASEQGTVYRLDPAKQQFHRHDSGYKGTFFGLLCQNDHLLAYGLGGNLYRSDDQGGNWTKQTSNAGASLTDAALLPDGRSVLVTQAGRIVVGNASGTQFRQLDKVVPMMLTSVIPANAGDIVVTGLGDGIRIVTVK